MMSESFSDKLDVRLISGGRKHMEMLRNGATEEDIAMLTQGRYVSYSNTFLYEYPSNEIYYLTERQFGVYVYCHWKLISDLLKVEQKFECAMIFLIALYKGANRFDLGVAGQEK
ncbi:MAG: hypothetical protein KDD45_17215 [Bdellovibrionales bacterium]|nr:hypothetical protein [Bdellovibrionales bacterium]